MQELMKMNYGGNMNRGFGGAPQPQRPNNRRNRGGGGNAGAGGQGGFRNNSRFEHNQPQNRNQQQNNRPVDAKPTAAAAPEQVNKVISAQATPPNVSVVEVPPKPQAAQQQPVVAQTAAAPQNQQPKPVPNKINQQASGPERNQTNNSGQGNQANHNADSAPGNNYNAGMDKKRNFGGPQNRQGGNFGAQNKQGGNRQSGAGGGPGSGQPRNQRSGPRGPGDKMGNMPPGAREEHMLASKLKDLAGPLIDLPPLEQSEVKFNGRSRLYIGNLSNEITEEEIQQMFATYGETSELFLNKEKNFAFIRMDFRANAEKAKHELDGTVRRGRPLRVRFAPHNSAVRVRNLTGFVTNELLYRAFEIFGKIERAYVKVDERGKSLNEGVVEYARKPSALAAIRNCTEKCFFLTSSLRPVIVESFEEPDEFDGYQEKNLPKKHPDFMRAREMGPRFSELNSFEHEYGTRWKQLHELYRQKEEALKTERASEEDKLEAQMEYAKYEHETELLREQLRHREQDRERQKRSWEMAERAAEERREADRLALARQEEELAARMRQQDDDLRRRQQENTLFIQDHERQKRSWEVERAAEERREAERVALARQDDGLAVRMRQPDDDLRRQQENALFIQAQRLNNMLDRQEQGMFDSHPQQQNMDGGYMEQYQDRGRGAYDDMPPSAQHWDAGRHQDDFPNKRRRF